MLFFSTVLYYALVGTCSFFETVKKSPIERHPRIASPSLPFLGAIIFDLTDLVMRNNDCRVYIIILWFSGRRHTSKQEHCIGLMYVPRVGNIWWFLILRIAREIMCDRSNYCIYGWNRFVLRKVLTLLTLPSGNTDDIRWDTPQHVLVDDVEGTDRPEIWPGTLVVLLLLSACPLTVIFRQGLQ